MSYLGRSPAVGTQRMLDSIESQFNGVLTTFDLRYGGVPTYPTLSSSLIVSLGGVLQEPGEAYYVSSDKIVFSQAPNAGLECWILLYSQYGTGVGAAQNGTLGAETLVLTGQLHGPANFIIDPAAVGDDTGTVEIKGNLTVQGTTTTINSTTVDLDHISLGDNEIANFGDGNDLRIYHDGNDSYITDTGVGNLHVNTNGSSIRFISDSSTTSGKIADFNKDGPVKLYYDNSLKFETTSDGIQITGRNYSTGDYAYFATSSSSNASLTLKKSAATADSIDYLQLRDSNNALKLKIGGDGVIYAIDVLASRNNDSDTRLRFPNDNTFSVETAGNEAFRVDSSGNLLVNTVTSPTASIKLLVSGNAGVSSGSYLSFRGEFGNTDEPAAHAIKYDSGLTGLQYYGYGGHAYFTGGQERLRITSTGNVGIGTTNPSEKLQVRGNILLGTTGVTGSTGALTITADNTSAANHSINFYGHPSGTNDSVVWHLSRNGGAYGYFDIRFANVSRIYIGGSSLANNGNITINPYSNTIFSSGNVGIGTTNPDTRLHIEAPWTAGASTNDIFTVARAGDAVKFVVGYDSAETDMYLGTNTNHTLQIRTNDSPRVTITNTGNVGIGTTNPSAKLEVYSGTNTQSPSTGGDNIVVKDSDGAGISILSGDGNSQNIYLGSLSSNNNVRFEGFYNAGSPYFKLYVGGSEAYQIDNNLNITPGADATQDFGSPTKRWANIYSADLQLSNEGSANEVDGTWGAYTIQEGEEELYLINRRSGKKFKFVLEEVK